MPGQTGVARWYTRGLYHVINQDVKLAGGTVKVAIVTLSYAPDRDAHEFWSTPQAFEVSGAGYTAGGILLPSAGLSYDTVTHETRFTGGNALWNPVTFSLGRWGIIYDSAQGSPAADILLGYVDFLGNQNPVADSFTIQWDPTAVLKVLAGT